MNESEEATALKTCLISAEDIQAKLDMRAFQLKALNDVSKELFESHFSVFIDAIHANNGDVNETAGDGLMVLFLNEGRQKNALDAVRTALTIQKEATRIGNETYSLYRPLGIHMGIHSGNALVGATKFSSLTGSRWTYTARGGTVNIAARIGSLATGSNILISRETADRVSMYQTVERQGSFKLKNVSDEVEIFKLLS
jgi:class 3 adenylate cyclase